MPAFQSLPATMYVPSEIPARLASAIGHLRVVDLFKKPRCSALRSCGAADCMPLADVYLESAHPSSREVVHYRRDPCPDCPNDRIDNGGYYD